MTVPEQPRDRLALFAPCSPWKSARRTLFVLALAVRLVFVLFLHSPRDFVFSDMQSYDQVALEALAGQPNVWHAFRPVGYSLLLAVVYAFTDLSRTFAGVLQAFMGAALAAWTADLARAAGVGRTVSLLAGLVIATSVPLTLYCGLLLTEIPSAFFLLLGLRLLMVSAGRTRPFYQRLLLAGLCLGLAGALRPNFLLVYAVVPFYVLFLVRRAGARPLPAWSLLGLGLALPLAVVCAYNSRALGRPAGPAANGGINFYLNFADVHTVQYKGSFGQYWISPVPNGFDHTRIEASDVPFFSDRYWYARGFAHVREHPESLWDALQNFPEAAGIGRQLMWPHWPGHERLLHDYAITFFGLVLVPALIGLGLCALRLLSLIARRARSNQAPERGRERTPQFNPEALTIAALCGSSIVPIYFFLGDPRVRVPFDPLWAVLAALALDALVRLLAARRTRLVHPDAPSLG